VREFASAFTMSSLNTYENNRFAKLIARESLARVAL